MHSTIDRVPRGPHRVIGSPAADGELHHVRHADNDGPCIDQALDGRSGRRSSLRRIALRPKAREATADLRKIFDCDRHAVQGPDWPALRRNPIQFFCPLHRAVRKNLDESMQLAVLRVDRVETAPHDRTGRLLASRNLALDVHDGHVQAQGEGPSD